MGSPPHKQCVKQHPDEPYRKRNARRAEQRSENDGDHAGHLDPRRVHGVHALEKCGVVSNWLCWDRRGSSGPAQGQFGAFIPAKYTLTQGVGGACSHSPLEDTGSPIGSHQRQMPLHHGVWEVAPQHIHAAFRRIGRHGPSSVSTHRNGSSFRRSVGRSECARCAGVRPVR